MDTQYYSNYNNNYNSYRGHYSDPYQPAYNNNYNNTSAYNLNESVLTLLFGGAAGLIILNCLYNVAKHTLI